MATKLEYLKKCVVALKPIENVTWYVSSLGIPIKVLTDVEIAKLDYLELFLKPDGLWFMDIEGEVRTPSRIDDCTKDTPLFSATDKVKVDSSWLSSITEPMETTVGRLLVNTVGIHATLGNRIGYFNKPFTIGAVEAEVSVRIKSVEDFKDPALHITVKEYVDCMDRIWFFSKISNLVTVAASPKIITAPPGIDALRTKLLKDNEGKLGDPVVIASITEQLNNYDKEYLKDDSAAKLILKDNKKGNTSRKKMYQMYGETNDFVHTSGSSPILTPMQSGVDTSEDILPKYVNDLRFASFSRGSSTALSGYSYKILQRSLSSLEVSDADCGVKIGLPRVVINKNKLVNRYVRLAAKPNDKWELVDTPEHAGKYLGVAITVRSPMFCKSPNNTVCYRCLGENYKGVKNAVNNMAAGFSGELMTLFLKRMHTSGFSLTDIQTKDLIT